MLRRRIRDTGQSRDDIAQRLRPGDGRLEVVDQHLGLQQRGREIESLSKAKAGVGCADAVSKARERDRLGGETQHHFDGLGRLHGSEVIAADEADRIGLRLDVAQPFPDPVQTGVGAHG